MNNTIILKRGTRNPSNEEYKSFQKGDTIYGMNAEPEELKRWNIADKAEALKELSRNKCSYWRGREDWQIEEYALEYCECNDDGEFISGSDYDLAELNDAPFLPYRSTSITVLSFPRIADRTACSL